MSDSTLRTEPNEVHPIVHLVRKISRLGAVDIPDLGIPMQLVCLVKPPIHYLRRHLEESLLVTLPYDLIQLWQTASELRLFEDVRFGQWGLILWSPLEIEVKHIQTTSERPEQYRNGDLIIGEFRGDQEKLLIRCSESNSDFGRIVVPLPIYKRYDWPIVANTLTDFLTMFVDADGSKYWEHHSQTK